MPCQLPWTSESVALLLKYLPDLKNNFIFASLFRMNKNKELKSKINKLI